jgi:hypothetical protein
MTQEETVLKHLKKHKEITCWEAIIKYHITRLPEMIRRLKKQGYPIETKIEYADKTHFARYQMRGIR